MSSELVNYSTGTTVTSNWLNHVQLREEGKASYVVYIVGGTIYAKAQSPGGLDYSGTDAATVIQNAITNLPSGGGLVYLKGPQTYTIASQINSKAGVVWKADKGVVLQASSTFSATAMVSSGGSAGNNQNDQIFDGLIFDGNYPTNTNVFRELVINYGARFIVKNCFFRNVYARFLEMDVGNVTDTVVESNFFSNSNFGDGILGCMPTRGVFSDNVYLNGQEITCGPGPTGINIHGNIFEQLKGYACLSFEPQSAGGAGSISDISITGNVFRPPTGAGVNAISFGGAPNSNQFCYNVSIAGNTINGHQMGIIGTSVRRCTIKGNIIDSTTQHGITFQDSIGLNISGNTVRNASSGGSADYAGITLTPNQIPMTDVLVNGNVVYDDRGTPLMPNCIRLNDSVAGTMNRITVNGNRLFGAATNLFSNNLRASNMSNLSVIGNPGYNPKGLIANAYENTSNFIGILGASSTLTSAKTYTCQGTPLDLYLAAGTISAMTKNGSAIPYNSTLTFVHLEPGDTWSITFTVTPTTNLVFGL